VAITLECGYDGANPQDPAAIQRIDERRFRVAPFSEDGDANYKFALNVRAVNSSSASESLTIDVEWNDLIYIANRGFVYVGQGDEWSFVPATIDGSVTTARLEIPPGVSYVGLSPAYGLADHQRFVAGLPVSNGFRREVIGHGDQGREIETFQIGSGSRSILVIARLHPYETAASFCAEGLMRWLVSADSEAERLRQDFRFVVVPMPNPDGVFLGLCKRTGLTGSDLSHEATDRRDAPARILMALIEELRPTGLLDIHGWMHLAEDGVGFVDAGQKDRFVEEIQKHPLFEGNVWLGSNALARPNAGNPRLDAFRRFGTRAIDLSYRWPGRNVIQMREIGVESLRAFCLSTSGYSRAFGGRAMP